MNDDWDVIGYVISSRYRIAVLEQLADSPSTPSKLATDTDLPVTHVSRALNDLRHHDLVRLLVSEERKKGRVYGITDRGQQIWDTIQTQDLVGDDA